MQFPSIFLLKPNNYLSVNHDSLSNRFEFSRLINIVIEIVPFEFQIISRLCLTFISRSAQD